MVQMVDDAETSASAPSPSCRVMGVLNVTPDSFSDGGEWLSVTRAVEHGRAMFAAGATVVDVGGESTRPGSESTSVREELARVVPVVEALGEVGTVSVDTRKAEVARACVRAGASIINDVSASLWPVAAELGTGWVAMHMKGAPQTMQRDPRYSDVTAEVLEYVVAAAERARSAGVARVWIDPGIGFGKTTAHNLTLLRDLGRFVATGLPVLVGASRKRFIGDIANERSAKDRLGGSVTVAVLSAMAGADIVRVHDVRETVQGLQVMEALAGRRQPVSR